MDSTQLKERLGAIEQLPGLPLVLRQVQKIMKNPNSNMNQIAAIIAKDQALASKTIRLVNSAFYGMSKPVTSIAQAIIILGLNTVNNIMLGLTVIKLFNNVKHTFDHESFWIHSFACGLMARSIAKQTHYTEPDDCFVVGLLHDMGRLVFDQFFHDEFYKIYKISIEKKVPLIQLERAGFGADHAFVGAHLLEEWKLPEILITTIKYHHNLDVFPTGQSDFRLITEIVAMADEIVNKEKIGNSGENFPIRIGKLNELVIDNLNIDNMISDVKSEVKETVLEWHK